MAKKKAVTNLLKAERVQTVNAIMQSIEREIDEVKIGTTPLDKARVISRLRQLQLQGVSL